MFVTIIVDLCLQESMDTLGQEIARMATENSKLQEQMTRLKT